MSTAVQTGVGRITQIIGPVLDVAFPPGKVPNIYNALVVKGQNEAGDDIAITCEVQQLLGDYCVRAVSMNATDGLMRGMDVVDTGTPLTVNWVEYLLPSSNSGLAFNIFNASSGDSL